MDFVDICIVGSGFGGAIAAARLAEHSAAHNLGASIRVLERGDDYYDLDPETMWKYRNAQGNGFKQTMKLDYLTRLLNVAAGVPDLESGTSPFTIVGGKGVGGGSLAYYAVSLRAPTPTFDQLDDGGARRWPSMYSRRVLDPYYERVERQLKVTRMAWSTSAGVPKWQLCTKRDYVFAQGCLAIGATAEPLKIATQNDANEGWWITGQRFSGRQSLPLNYLRAAKDHGVQIHSGCDVRWVAPSGKGGYVVRYHDARSGTDVELECKMLVLAGGVLGSTGVLLKSSDNFTGARALSDRLGRHVSGNGDYGLAGIVGKRHSVEGYKGKPMSSVCFSFFNEHKFALIPFYAPPLMMAFGQPVTFAYPKRPGATGAKSTEPSSDRSWGKDYKDVMSQFGDRLLTLGVLGWDHCEGELKKITTPLGPQIVADWPRTHFETERMWSAAVTTSRRIFNALGGELLMDSYRHTGGVGTVHPLGGCRMAETKNSGVVNPFGEVFDNPNLFVLDGSIVPSALGVNPSLTISAVAELALSKLTANLAQRLGRS